METSLIGKALDFGSSDYRFDSYVSKFINQNVYLHLISSLKINLAKKRLFFDLRVSKKGVNLLKVLEKLHIIRFYYKINSNFFRIYLVYNRFFKKSRILNIYCKKGNPLRLSLKALVLINITTPYSHFLLETSRGILTIKEAIYYKVGGFPVLFLS